MDSLITEREQKLARWHQLCSTPKDLISAAEWNEFVALDIWLDDNLTEFKKTDG